MKRFLILIFLLISISGFSQKEAGIDFQVDLFTRHYWRGFVFGNTPAIEPQITLSVNRFSFNVWAAQTFNESYSEIDLIPSYSFGNYALSFLEYYNPVQDEENRYFDLSPANSRHSGEFMLSYNGAGKLPFRWMVATFMYGDGHPEEDRHMYSTYIEAGMPFTIAGADAEISVGITPWESFYADRFTMVHAGISVSDNISLGDGKSAPLRLSFMSNPGTREAWVIFSIGLNYQRSSVKPN
jgi:hypothetical protein